MLISCKTQPKESGPNPNINTVVKFEVNLPKKEIFVPELQCCVNDYMLAGLVNPLLGVFMIPVNTVINDHKYKFQEDFDLLLKNYTKFSDPNYKEGEEERILKEGDIKLLDVEFKKIIDKKEGDKKDIELDNVSSNKKDLKEALIQPQKSSKNCIYIIPFYY